jgi:DNA-binding IclR family transcriptional regulator
VNVRSWGFLTNHAHVLIQVVRNPTSTVREIAQSTGITERATHSVLRDLRESNIVLVRRAGRRNVYEVDPGALANYPRWAASEMEVPRPLIEAAIRGLARLAGEPEERQFPTSRSA